ncbi:protein phosphatase 2C domain-containing protein [Streptomyces sp. NBC_01264]|uniref:protein phosphatase 2C domain-containing protein n=1 Tax=Streptomyces sp. NBC_01264 TaxID=2903804 RepID=UPI0022506465|nr:protein phosphatase 2C domain-containing protein [Streptomyces sp. NBC_01264]MCX4778442.1 protein phosphatase 2C domain-containing protein [Streptomyces sp. NBC_01264]
MSMHRLSGCPSCAEPLEEGDRFCGLCGYALTTPDRTAAHTPPAAPTSAAYAAPVAPAGAAPAAPAPPVPAAPAPPAPPAPEPAGSAHAGATGQATPPAGIPATRGLPSSGEDFAPRHSGGHPEPAAPGYAGEAAPGWGSVSTAAPTLVSGPTGWSDAGHGTPRTSESPYATPPQGPHPAEATSYGAGAQGAGPTGAASYGRADGSDAYGTPGPGEHALPYEATPYDPAPQGQHPGGPAPYGGPPSPEYAPGGEAPYGGPAPQGQHGGETPYGGPTGGHGAGHGPQEPGPGHEAPYGGPAEQGHAPGGEVPYVSDPSGQGPAPQGDPGGKTCVACRAGRVDTDGYCEHCGHAQPRERDHLEEELGSVAAVSDRGLRHHRNEDSFAVAATALPDGSAATVAIVCDGVSSASRPDEASAAAAGAANEALLDALPRGAHPQEAMHEAILAAAAAVNALAPEVPSAQNAPACTLVGAVVSGGLLTIGWVGDSRAYWVPDDRAALPRRLTEDDSWAAQMVAAGLMGEAEAYADVRAHAITGWLGADAYDLEPHTATFKPDHDGVVVVCTDGLWNYAESAGDMARVLPQDAAVRPLHSAQVLVGHALDGGGHDNVTVAIVPFAATPPVAQHPSAPQAPPMPPTPPTSPAGPAGPQAQA